MKILLSLLVCLIPLFKIQAAPVTASGWTTTTNPITARNALGLNFFTSPFLTTNDERTALFWLQTNEYFGIDTPYSNAVVITTNCTTTTNYVIGSIVSQFGANTNILTFTSNVWNTVITVNANTNFVLTQFSTNFYWNAGLGIFTNPVSNVVFYGSVTPPSETCPDGFTNFYRYNLTIEYEYFTLGEWSAVLAQHSEVCGNQEDVEENLFYRTNLIGTWDSSFYTSGATSTNYTTNCVTSTNSAFGTNTIRLKNGQVILNDIVFDGSGATSGVSAATVYNILASSNLVNVPTWQATNTEQRATNAILRNADSALTANLTTVSNLAATNMFDIVSATNVLKGQLTTVSNQVATNEINFQSYTSALPAQVGSQIASSNLVKRLSGTSTNQYLDNPTINHMMLTTATNTGPIYFDYSVVEEPVAIVGVENAPPSDGIDLPIGSLALMKNFYPYVKTGAVDTAWERLATVKNVVNATNTLMSEIRYKVRDLSTNATLGNDHTFILVNTAAGNINVTLPPSPPDGFFLQIANVGAFGLYIIPNAGHTIDGSGSSLYVPTIQSTRGLMFHGTNWKRF
jgi:hypothetical protein